MQMVIVDGVRLIEPKEAISKGSDTGGMYGKMLSQLLFKKSQFKIFMSNKAALQVKCTNKDQFWVS